MADLQTLEIPVHGMDCSECTQHVQKAIAVLPGVESVHVLLSAEKAVIQLDPSQVDLPAIRAAVTGAGYAVDQPMTENVAARPTPINFTRQILTVFGIVFAVVLFVVVVGEGMGLFETITSLVPWPIGAMIVLAAGFPIFRNVVRATLRGQVISHTLMSIGALAAVERRAWRNRATSLVSVAFRAAPPLVCVFARDLARHARLAVPAWAQVS